MIWILAAFLLLHLLFLRQRAADEDGFFLAKRQFHSIKLGMSLVATVLGASAVLGTVGWGYEYGLAGSAWLLAGVVGLGFLWVLVPALPERRAVSIAGLVGSRAGSLSGRAVAVVIVPMWIAVAAAQVKALAALLAAHSALTPPVAAALVCALVPLYLWRGGQKAVVESDAVQFWFILIAVALGFAATLMAGAGFDRGAVRPIGAEVPLWTLFPVMLSYLIGPDIHSRLLVTGRVADRRRALLFAMLTLTAVSLALAAIGWAAHGRVAPAQAWRTGLVLVEGLPFPLAVVMNLALMAALLSSLDTTLMTTGTLLAVDLGGGGVRGARFAVVGVSVAAGVVSQAGAGLIPLLMMAYQWYAGVLGPTVLFALFGRGRNPWPAVLAAVLGSAVLLGGGLLLGLRFAFEAAFAWGIVAMAFARWRGSLA
jgi:solute:Na+ symporter, SSS family